LSVGSASAQTNVAKTLQDKLAARAPCYLAARGMPKRPADLAGHECLRLARRQYLHDRWRFRTEHGVEEIVVGGHLSSSSGDVLHGWSLEGRGLSSEALWDVAEDLQAGRLVPALPITPATKSSCSPRFSLVIPYHLASACSWISWRSHISVNRSSCVICS
jgi:DNA-binding transcriptional LysR family regulator